MDNQLQRAQNLFLKLVNERLWMVNDCKTIMLARQENASYWGTGGGNFLMTIGLMSVLGFLSKLFLCLTDPTKIVKKEDFDGIKTLIKELKSDNKYQILINKINVFPMKKGLTNETEAFCNFCYIIQKNNIVDFGFPNEERACKEAASNAWMYFRNKLIHMAWPYQQVAVFGNLKGKSKSELELIIKKSPHKSFFKDQQYYRCIPDKLIYNILDIQEWLIKQTKSGAFDQNINFSNQWMEDKL